MLVRDRAGGEEIALLLFVTGVSLLATHTTVSPGMSLYQMPRYSLPGVELVGEKKPKAKLPPSDTMVAPGESGLPGTSRSSVAHGDASRRRTVACLISSQAIEHLACTALTS